MPMIEPVHIPYAWQCCDCGQYGNSGSVCPACASRSLWPVGKLLPVLDRVLTEKGRAA